MNKFTKAVLIAGAGVAGIALLVLLAINLYVESSRFQAQLESHLSRELEMPLKVGRIHLSPFGKLKARDLSIPIEREGSSVEFLHIPNLSARVAWGPLFTGKLVVEELTIHSPKVEWMQGKKGRWKLPKIKKEKKEVADPEPQAPTETAPAEEPAPAPRRKLFTSRQPLEFRIAVARLDHGTFRFVDRKGRELARFEGVSVSCPEIRKGSFSGVADIEKVTFHEKWVLHHFRTPFAYQDGELTFPEIQATIGGGTLTGTYQMQPEEEGSPFRLKIDLGRVDLGEVLREAGVDSTLRAEGLLQGTLTLEGRASDEKSIQGGGSFTLDQGRMEQNVFAQMLGQALQVEEFSRLELQESRLNCRVGDGRVYIEELFLATKNLQLMEIGRAHV